MLFNVGRVIHLIRSCVLRCNKKSSGAKLRKQLVNGPGFRCFKAFNISRCRVSVVVGTYMTKL